MRPLPIVLFALVLLALIGGLWLTMRPSTAPTVAVDAQNTAREHEAPAQPTELDASDARETDRESTTGATAATPAAAPAASPMQAHGAARPGEERAVLKGRVVDAHGAPVEGARVLAASAIAFFDGALDTFDEDEPWMRRAEAKTDAQGRFEIDLTAKKSVRLAVRKDGFVPHDEERVIAATKSGAQDLGDIALDASVVLTGRVTQTGGVPVAGAKLFRLPHGDPNIVTFAGERGVLVAETDAGGRFRVAQLAPGPWRLRIASEAHPDRIEEGETEQSGQQVTGLEFVLEEGTEITGRVVQAPPELLKSLWVRAAPRAANAEQQGLVVAPMGGVRRARVNPDGTFALKGLKQDTNYAVFARDSEREWGGRRRTVTANVKSGDRGVSLMFQPETAIVCQVVDSTTGEPLTELDVRAGTAQWSMPLMDEQGRRQKRFPEGRVRFGNLQPPSASSTAQIAIECVGYLPYAKENLMLVQGQDYDLGVVRMTRAPLAKVRVTDANTGAPIAGARVRLRAESPADPDKHDFFVGVGEEEDNFLGTGASNAGRTDADGWAKVTSLPNQRAFVWIGHPDYASMQTEPELLPAGEDWVKEVKLVHGGTVVVEVLDAHKQPVAGRHVAHEGPEDQEGGPIRFGGEEDQTTDSAGRVTFEHLVPGVHRFRMGPGDSNTVAMEGGAVMQMRRSIRGLPDAGEAWNDVTVEDEQTYTLQIVAPASSQVVGRITEAGRPLSGATVRLSESDSPTADLGMMFGEGKQGRTNGKGEFTIEDVDVGKYRASVTHASRSMPHEVEIEVREGDNELAVDLSVAIVEGRVTDHEQKPLAGVRVRAERSRPRGEGRRMMATAVMFTSDGGDEPAVMMSSGGAASSEVQTDADGRYRLRGVAPDTDIVVKATGKEVQPGESPVFRVAPDQTKTGVDVQLEQGGAIEVKIEHADGRPAPTYLVRAEKGAEQGGEPKMQVSGPNGIAKFSGLPPGSWRLHVQSLGGGGESDGPADQDVIVAVGETAKARFEVP